jgi:hypothetical protein
VSNIAGAPSGAADLFGVDENYMTTIYDEYFIASAIDDQFTYHRTPHGKDDVIRSLYENAGQAVMPMEEGRKIPGVVGSGPWVDVSQYEQALPYAFPKNPYKPAVPSRLLKDENATYTQYIDVIACTAHNGLQAYIKHPMQLIQLFRLTASNYASRNIYLAKPRAFVSKMPGFFFTWLTILARAGMPVLVSMDSFTRIQRDAYEARLAVANMSAFPTPPDYLRPPPEKPPKAKLLVRLRPDATRDDREFVINGIKNFVKSNLIIVTDTNDIIESTYYATSLLMLFFYVVTTISILLCFFVLWISFTSNVNENSWEFGVLRAVGLNLWEVTSIYIFEALSIILTSVILATIIGLAVALTLKLQFALFNQMAVEWYFPTGLFTFVFILSFVVSIIGSWLPARKLSKKQIAQTIRGQ